MMNREEHEGARSKEGGGGLASLRAGSMVFGPQGRGPSKAASLPVRRAQGLEAVEGLAPRAVKSVRGVSKLTSHNKQGRTKVRPYEGIGKLKLR